MPYKNIARIIPTLMSSRIASENIKKTKKKNLGKLAVRNIVNLELMRATAGITGGL